MAVGAEDPLIGDTQKLYDQLTLCGAKPRLEILPELPHGFLMWTATLAPALSALERAAHEIKSWLERE
jgi:acetyl esterase